MQKKTYHEPLASRSSRQEHVKALALPLLRGAAQIKRPVHALARCFVLGLLVSCLHKASNDFC